MSDQYVDTSVAPLFFGCCPANIARLIAKGVIDAVEGTSLFAAMGKLRYVIVESYEVMSPFIANRDAASSPIRKILGVWIGTTIFHATPNLIQRVASHSVNGVSLRDDFFGQAAAGFCVTPLEISARKVFGVAAIALTKPNDIAAFGLPNWAKRDKATKSLVGNIFGVFGKGDKLVGHQNLQFWRLIRQRLVIVGRYCYGMERL